MNHYDILAVPRDATLDTIRASYAAQMNVWSVSTDPSAEQRRHQIQTAYVVLTDTELRATYDARLSEERHSMSSGSIGTARMPTVNEIAAYENQAAVVLAQDAFAQKRWAGFWFRFGAQLLDAMILYLPSVFLITAIAGALVALKANGVTLICTMYGAYALLFALYQGWLNSSEELSTWGRRAVGIAIVSESDGKRIDFMRAFGRGLLSLICAMLVFPNLLQLFTTRRQSLPDLITWNGCGSKARSRCQRRRGWQSSRRSAPS